MSVLSVGECFESDTAYGECGSAYWFLSNLFKSLFYFLNGRS